MAESIARSLRDGAHEGEHAPALAIKDSLRCPLGHRVFHHFVSSIASHIVSGTSQARALVIVGFNRSPDFYTGLLKERGLDASFLNHSVGILDCYSDPLGWKGRSTTMLPADELNKPVFRNVRDINMLLSTVLDLGKGFVGQAKERFAVAIDLVSTMIRHCSLPSVSRFLSYLRSHDQISCIFWLIHSDLHEAKATLALEYNSTMIVNLEPLVQSTDGQSRLKENLFWQHNTDGGKIHTRLKRRNGRVKMHFEVFHVEQHGITITTESPENVAVNQILLPKVQFNLQLSEKERVERAKVVLPFEHQGNGENIQIYDGRQTLPDGQKDLGMGEIHYVRDSDDECPDSDEDPDDDLDI